MLIGAHSIIYSKDPEADRAFFRNVLRLPSVDVGHGWLIFGLPPSEVAVHPSDRDDAHEFYLMCDDVNGFIEEMQSMNIACAPIQIERWGLLTRLQLPGGGTLRVYQPRHPRPRTVRPIPANKRSSLAARKKAKRFSASSRRRPHPKR